MRDAAAWLELPANPHPTPLRGATFSHEWEKGGALLSRDRRADHVERDVSAADHQFVAKPEEAIAMFAQPGVARSVVSLLLVAIMRRSVEFDREAMLDAEEIHDIAADGNLAAELQPVQGAAAQRPPEHRLGLRHVAPKFAGECGVVFRNAGGHGEVSPKARAKASGARPSPVYGRRWPGAAGSDEGRRGLVGTSKNPHPTSLRGAAFFHQWEKDAP